MPRAGVAHGTVYVSSMENHKLPHPHAEAQSSSVPSLTHPRALKTSQRNTQMYSCDFREVILFVFDGL